MKRVMFVALALLMVGAAAFAVDFSASVDMKADLWGTNGFVMGNPGQSDADLLVFAVSTDVAGANAQIRTGNAKDDTTANVRNLAVWFKPVSQLKITVGNIGSGLYTEQLNWWHVPNGQAAGNGWASAAGVPDNKGLLVEVTPVDGLTIAAGIAPGFGNPLLIDADAATTGNQLAVGPNTKWGLLAKYNIKGFGSVGAAYRYNGATTTSTAGVFTSDWQTVRIGVDVNAVPGLYAFVTGIVRFDANASSVSSITVDNYAAYTAGAFTVKGEFPVTIRTTGVATDHSYLSYDVKASYKVLDNFSPFFRITQDGASGDASNCNIEFGNIHFAPKVQLGADYSFGKASLNTAIRIDVPAAAGGTVTWSIPFECRVSW